MSTPTDTPRPSPGDLVPPHPPVRYSVYWCHRENAPKISSTRSIDGDGDGDGDETRTFRCSICGVGDIPSGGDRLHTFMGHLAEPPLDLGEERDRWASYLADLRAIQDDNPVASVPTSAQRARILQIWGRASGRFGRLRPPTTDHLDSTDLELTWSYPDLPSKDLTFSIQLDGQFEWSFIDDDRDVFEISNDLDRAIERLGVFCSPSPPRPRSLLDEMLESLEGSAAETTAEDDPHDPNETQTLIDLLSRPDPRNDGGLVLVSCTCTVGDFIVQARLLGESAFKPLTCPRCGAKERAASSATTYVRSPWEELDARQRMHGVFDAEGLLADPIAIFRTQDAAERWIGWQFSLEEAEREISIGADHTIMVLEQLEGVAWNSHEPPPESDR